MRVPSAFPLEAPNSPKSGENESGAASPLENRLAAASQQVASSVTVIDRSFAPLDAAVAVALPQCPAGCAHRARRARAIVSDVGVSFADLLEPATIAAMSARERSQLVEPRLDSFARRVLDSADGPAIQVEPGLEDLARLTPSNLALAMLVLEPLDRCDCYAALVAAIPTDEVLGILALAKIRSELGA